MSQLAIDEARSGRFSERMVNLLNESVLAMMISIGHRTRLFDKMTEMEPATSEEIAVACPKFLYQGL